MPNSIGAACCAGRGRWVGGGGWLGCRGLGWFGGRRFVGDLGGGWGRMRGVGFGCGCCGGGRSFWWVVCFVW